MQSSSKKLLMASAVAGLMSVAPASLTAGEHEGSGEGEKVHCYGVNKCKGTGACGGKHADGTGYSCAGNNKCKGLGWLSIDKETCLKIDGGRLTPQAAEADSKS